MILDHTESWQGGDNTVNGWRYLAFTASILCGIYCFLPFVVGSSLLPHLEPWRFVYDLGAIFGCYSTGYNLGVLIIGPKPLPGVPDAARMLEGGKDG
jgi:hypothetical protein